MTTTAKQMFWGPQTSKTMFIWCLQVHCGEYDAYTGVVVVASTETDARNIAATRCKGSECYATNVDGYTLVSGDELENVPWDHPLNPWQTTTECEKLGPYTGTASLKHVHSNVILTSYHAG